jgi:hypothetical protein
MCQWRLESEEKRRGGWVDGGQMECWKKADWMTFAYFTSSVAHRANNGNRSLRVWPARDEHIPVCIAPVEVLLRKGEGRRGENEMMV